MNPELNPLDSTGSHKIPTPILEDLSQGLEKINSVKNTLELRSDLYLKIDKIMENSSHPLHPGGLIKVFRQSKMGLEDGWKVEALDVNEDNKIEVTLSYPGSKGQELRRVDYDELREMNNIPDFSKETIQ